MPGSVCAVCFAKFHCDSFTATASGLIALLLVSMAINTAAHARDGAAVYDETCLLCHGPITEESAWYHFLQPGSDPVQLAVVTPRGPTLNGIVGRPAGIISNYKYSKGMRKFAASGAVWDRATLEQFLTNSRQFVKGTFMIMKMNEADRKRVLDYLESIAVYRQ